MARILVPPRGPCPTGLIRAAAAVLLGLALLLPALPCAALPPARGASRAADATADVAPVASAVATADASADTGGEAEAGAEAGTEAEAGDDALTIRLSTATTGRAGVTGNQAWFGDLETALSGHRGRWRAGYERRDFFWNNTSRLQFADGEGAPWRTLHRWYAARDLFDGEYERFDYFAGLLADVAFETQPDDAAGLGGYGHLAVDVWEGLKLGVEGGGSLVRVRGGDLFTRSDLRVHLELPETRIRQWLLRQIGLSDERGALSLGVEYLNRRRLYRLADGSQVKGRGYVDLGEASLGLPVTLRLAPGIEARVIPRYHLPRTLNFYDRQGGNVGRLRTGHSFGGALELDWTFGL